VLDDRRANVSVASEASGGGNQPGEESLAASLSGQIDALLTQSEHAADAIKRESAREADQIRDVAVQDANRIGADAERTRAQIAERATSAAQRVEEDGRALIALMSGLETEIDGLANDLARIRAELGSPDPSAPTPAFRAERVNGAGLAEPRREAVEADASGEARPDAQARDVPSSVDCDPAYIPPGTEEDEIEKARLVALNMAVNKAPREETERYLTENFELARPDELLEEAYRIVPS